MSEIIFSVSGVRGIYGDSLTLPVVVHYTLAFAKFCRDNKKSRKIVVGQRRKDYGRRGFGGC